MWTQEQLEAARAAQWERLCGVERTEAELPRLIADLGLATSLDLEVWAGTAAHAWAEAALARGEVAELTLWHEGVRYASREALAWVYALAGDRNPRRNARDQAERGKLSLLAAEIFEIFLDAREPLSGSDLRARLGRERTSVLGTERALAELADDLKILRVGRRGGESVWRAATKAQAGLATEAGRIPASEAAGALLALRLQRLVCATAEELAGYFAPLISGSRVRATLRGLESGGAAASDTIEGRTALRWKEPRATGE